MYLNRTGNGSQFQRAGGRSDPRGLLRRHDGLGKVDALRAFGLAAGMAENAAGIARAVARGLADILFANGIADADDHLKLHQAKGNRREQ